MHATLNIAVKAARRAATVINRASTQLDLLTVQSKSPNDFVTEVDRAAEQAIIDVLRDGQLVATVDKIHRELGWSATHDLRQMVASAWDAWNS